MKDVMRELFPPEIPPVVKWRLAHFLLGVVMLLFMFWALGAFAFFGFPGFARASDQVVKDRTITSQIASVNQEIKAMKVDQLEQRIYDTQRLLCSSSTTDSRRFYSSQVSRMIRDYYNLTNVTFRLPDCDELG